MNHHVNKRVNTELIKPLEELALQGSVTVRDVFAAFGYRSYGFVIFLLSFIIVIPTGIIPGVAIATSCIVLLVVAQYALGRTHIYLPQWVATRSVSPMSIKTVITYLEKYSRVLGWLLGKEKNQFLFDAPWSYVTIVLLVLVALSTVPFTFFVFIEMIPGSIMMLYGLSLIARNGRLLLATWCISIGHVVAVYYLIQYLINLL